MPAQARLNGRGMARRLTPVWAIGGFEVPLSDPAMVILRSLPKVGGSAGFVFTTTRASDFYTDAYPAALR